MTYPNWENIKDYEYTGNLDRIGWAWEFLRRNQEYRDTYLTYKSEAEIIEKEYGPNWADNANANIHSPPLLDNESEKQWIYRCEIELGVTPRKIRIDYLYGEHYFLKRMIDPNLTIGSEVEFVPPMIFPAITETAN